MSPGTSACDAPTLEFAATSIPGPLIVKPTLVSEQQASFWDVYTVASFEHAGLKASFVHDSLVRSQKGFVHGLRFQFPCPQGKLLKVVSGSAFLVAVDLRWSSPYFGKWVGLECGAGQRDMLLVPEGFAQGFMALEDDTTILEKCTSPPFPEFAHVLAWDEPALGIEWPKTGHEVFLSTESQAARDLVSVPVFP